MQQTASIPGAERLHAPRALGSMQAIAAFALGIFFWFLAAMFVRVTEGTGIFGGQAGIVTFIAGVPASWLIVVIVAKLARLAKHQLTSGIAIATGAATLCDGLAMTWFPSLYGNDPRWVLFGAAFILWGVGVILIVSVVLGRTIDH
jgi:hypothetical protein